MIQLRRYLVPFVLLAAFAMPAVGLAQAPTFQRQPLSTLIAPGATAFFDVAVDPTAPNVRYQWRLNGGNLPGEISPSLALSNVQFSAAGIYTVVAYNDFGAATSDPAQLMLNNLLSLPFSDQFNGAVTLTPSLSGRVRGSNVNATGEAGEPLHAGGGGRRSVWAKWTAPASPGIVTFRTAGSGFDTLLAVYTGSQVFLLNDVGSDDDGDGFLTSRVRFQAQPGVEYYIAIDGFAGTAGQFILDWNLEQTAQLLPIFTVQPSDQTVLPGSDVLFAVAGDSDQAWQWFFDGQPINGAVSSTLALGKVGPAEVGTYFCRAFRAGQVRDSRPARLQFNIDDFGRPGSGVLATEKLFDSRVVVNDFRASRFPRPKTVARGFSGTQVFSTVGSTKEIGEPNHCGIAGGASEWYAIQAEADGTLSINTDGSNFDTVLAVYTGPGDDFATLTSVACDNNSGLDGKDSRVSIQATAATIYWIAVDGVNNPSTGNPARGHVVLNYRLVLPLRLTALAYTNAGGGRLTFHVSGTPNLPATIQGSSNLASTNWTSLFTNSSPSGTFHYTNAGGNIFPQQVFRAVNWLN